MQTNSALYPAPYCKITAAHFAHPRVIGNSSLPPFPQGTTLEGVNVDCTNLGHGIHYRIVACTSCQFAFCTPRPSVEALLSAYSASADNSYVSGEDGRRRTFRSALNNIPRSQGRLLDVGCQTGVFLDEARHRGFQCYGIEPSSFAAERAKSVYGLDVITGSVPCKLPWEFCFEVITLWDVIEHVDNPLEILAFLREQLVTGGELHLSTMDFGSLYARLAGAKWPWLMQMHIQYFTKATMRAMLAKVGFKKIEIGRYRHIVHESYLETKLAALHPALQAIGQIGKICLRDKDGFVRVSMGDMMHVRAVR